MSVDETRYVETVEGHRLFENRVTTFVTTVTVYICSRRRSSFSTLERPLTSDCTRTGVLAHGRGGVSK